MCVYIVFDFNKHAHFNIHTHIYIYIYIYIYVCVVYITRPDHIRFQEAYDPGVCTQDTVVHLFTTAQLHQHRYLHESRTPKLDRRGLLDSSTRSVHTPPLFVDTARAS